MPPRLDSSMLTRVGRGVLLLAIAQCSGRVLAGPQLPVPCVAGSCGTNASGFLSPGTHSSATAVQSGNQLTINQTSNLATLNWSSFNIGAGGKVVFQQPASTSIALNRIWSANPSSIFGALSANGEIYLINANGFVFGATATVNVAGLVASSLNITDSTFAAGILAPGSTSVAPALAPLSSTIVPGDITVAAGATLTAADGGSLLLSAPNVTNSGTLTAPDGQIILAAGQKLYLQGTNSTTPYLRGLLVEVDGGGTAANLLGGTLSAARGNVTLAGLMVNQDGRVSATTSVSANGSIFLQADDNIDKNVSVGQPFQATQGGTVTLGPGSVTEILPEYTDTATAVAAQTQLPSTINITGQQVMMHDATLDAPSGVLTVMAVADPAAGFAQSNPQSQIRIDAGTTIDLSGSNANLPMSANLLSVQLRSNEFADDPTQRGGALQSTPTNVVTVTVDVRADGGNGTPIADIQSAIADIGQNIAQRTETGGKAVFQSEGDVVLAPGASINVSGGATTYAAGSIQTTKLVGANGQLYDIGSANPLLSYVGLINPTFTETSSTFGIRTVVPTPGLSQYESSYVQGAAAGDVQFAAPSLLLSGSLQGSAVSGALQRGTPPAGGTLIIGASGGVGSSAVNAGPDLYAPSVSFAATPLNVGVADGAPLPPQTLELPTAYLTSDGFTTTQIYSNVGITLPANTPLTLLPSAQLTLVAPRVEVDSSITAIDGKLSFDNELTSATVTNQTPRAGVLIGDGVTLDVSGQWTNDGILANGVGTAPTLQNGGSIALAIQIPNSELVLGNQVSLKANGGAWLQSGGAVTDGKGGSITLDASPSGAALQVGQATVVQGFGVGTAQGGAFALSAPRIAVSQGTSGSWTEAQTADDLNATTGPVFNVYAPLFSGFGFSSITLTATGAVESTTTNDVLSVASGTTLNAQTSTLQLNPGYANVPTGTAVSSLTSAALLPTYDRPVESVTLNVLRNADDVALSNTGYGLLDIQPGATLNADPGATVTLQGEGGVLIGGTVRAPGGTIAVSVPSASDVNAATVDALDPGFVPTLGIDLKPTAVLDVSGTSILNPSSQGLLLGSILSGGSVTLQANRGTVVTETGSSIDISGTASPLDVPNSAVLGGYSRQVVASAGGSLTVTSPESISLLGTLSGAAGAGTTGAAAAGSLTIDLVRSVDSTVQNSSPALPTGTLQIDLLQTTAGTSPLPPDSNTAIVGAQQIAASGIDSLTLRAGGSSSASGSFPAAGSILLDATSLALNRQLILDAPALSVPVNASVSAPFVELGNSVASVGVVPTAPSPGNGVLNVTARQMVLNGQFAIEGTSSVVLRSTGDVQLQGTVSSNSTGPTTGSLVTDGNLELDALRVYPDTYTSYAISSLPGNGATLRVGSTGASPGSPLSADGTVSLSADHIDVTGTLLAPFGNINLSANSALTLESSSVLSVSGAGLDVPFGETELSQGVWVYVTPGAANGGLNVIPTVPSKQITLTAPTITVQARATANIQGGGNLYAYEWVPGTGGTYDNLNTVYQANTPAASNIPNLYAILPSSRGQAGPYDPQESGLAVPGQSQALPGQTIYLSGGAGIAAGYYALLPPRYALEPGAVLIQLEPSYASASGGQIGALANGTPVIGGYVTTGTTGLHTGLAEYEGVAIYPTGNAQTPGYAQQIADYALSSAGTFFQSLATAAGAGTVASPADAGTFTLSVTPAAVNTLDLQGTVLTAAASGGQGAQINLSAPDLLITAGVNPATPGSVSVAASVVQAWDASSITLGGIATAIPATTSGSTTTPASTDIAVAASNVTIESGAKLTADQIDIVALQSIVVQSGASLASTSGAAGKALANLPSVQNVTLTDASAAQNPLTQAALLSLSDVSLAVVNRTPPTDPTAAAAAAAANPASVTLDAGSTLSFGGAFAADAPGKVSLGGTLNGTGASWSLSSGSVALGAANSADTLTIGTGLLNDLQQAGAVRLASQGAIDIESPVSLGVSAQGTPNLGSLTLIASAINNPAQGTSTFGADVVNLAGLVVPPTAGPLPPASAGAGTLNWVAGSLTTRAGVLTVNGFAQTTARVAGALETQGGGYLNVGGNLTLDAAEITPAPDAVDEPGATLAASGLLTLGAAAKPPAGTPLPTLIGGSLTLRGSDIEDGGSLAAPAGVVELISSGPLNLLSTAVIAASATQVSAVSQTADAPGGIVMLSAGTHLGLATGSVIDVAGNAGAPAGTLSLSGAGSVSIAGTLNGAGNGSSSGSLSVDAGTLTGGLAELVGASGFSGFNAAVDVRVRSGSLELPGTASITANDLVLTADTGSIDIAGILSAPSAAQRGLIDLSGGTGVTLTATGQLHADGSGPAGRGGEIDMNSTCAGCTLVLDPGSVISTAGMAQLGDLVLRAPGLLSSNDVAINPGSPAGLGAEVAQVGTVIIQPVFVRATSASSFQDDLSASLATAQAFLTPQTQQAIAARLANSSGTSTSVQAGIELQDPTVSDTLGLPSKFNLDLTQYSAQGEIISLAVRAAGSITLDGKISDGFNEGSATTLFSASPGSLTNSGSLSFVAGADLASANPLAVLANGPGAASLTLGPQSLLRTGTGDINLAAAGNVNFASDAQGGASVYTGGLAGATAFDPSKGRLANFGYGGGNVSVAAGGSVVSGGFLDPALDGENFSVTGWLVRGVTLAAGNTPAVGEYGVNFDEFDWNVGALGGGDVTVRAGGAVTNVSAATAASSPNGNATIYGAGGGLLIQAVGDVASPQVYVGSGIGTVVTGAGITADVTTGITTTVNGVATPVYAGASFALGDAQVAVWARQAVQIDAVYNPTAAPASTVGQVLPFFTYGADSALDVSSTDGAISMTQEPRGTLEALLGAKLGPLTNPNSGYYDLPPDLSLQSLQQDLVLNANTILFPSSSGQLRLFAGRDIDGNSAKLALSDNLASSVPTPSNLAPQLNGAATAIGGLEAFQGAIHVGDTTPASITAGRDINDLVVSIPKPAQVSAGRDIVNLGYEGQNLAATDTTLITAGRDISYPVTLSNGQANTGGSFIELGGPGSLDLFAGRNVNLGLSDGITTVGSFVNPNLPTSSGANVTLAVGYGTPNGADDAGFLSSIIAPSPTYQTELIDDVESLTGATNLTYNQAQTAFEGFSLSQQSALIDQVFFNELLLSGRAANSGTGVGFTEGYAAIAALFPTTAANPTPYHGSLSLIASQIYTLSGGNMSILVPGGQIDVGLAYTPAGIPDKPANELGIVAEGAGNIDIYAQGDVNVNASRIFTLGGGNILIWSDTGSIDAGNGSKSSLSVPPPVITINQLGQVTLDYGSSLAQGSGIRTIETSPSVPPGNVDLDAPVGTVNAGDAGIGASGNINIAAAHVIGALNINFGGQATGVPSDLSGLGASLSGVAAVANSSTQSATQSAANEANQAKETTPLAQTELSWLEVFVTGLGEENCKQDDIECLKRQKSAAP